MKERTERGWVAREFIRASTSKSYFEEKGSKETPSADVYQLKQFAKASEVTPKGPAGRLVRS